MAYIDTDAAPPAPPPISWLPFRTRLRDGTAVVLRRVSPRDAADAPTVAAMHALLNYELVVRGDSYPFPPRPLTREQFIAYFFARDAFALLKEDAGPAPSPADALVGCFYIKPNYPYRSAHVCNAGFIVARHMQRGRGAGEVMGRAFVVLAADLGYRASMFNLVYATNKGSIRLWEKLGHFRRVSVIPGGGRVKRHPPADAGGQVSSSSTAAGSNAVGASPSSPGTVAATAIAADGEAVPAVAPAEEETVVVDAYQYYCDLRAAAPDMRAALGLAPLPPLAAAAASKL